MDQPFDVLGAESQAAKEMQRRIADHLSYAEGVHRLLDLATSYYDEREVREGSSDYVALLLMGRMANDMRAIAALARLGYGVQACTLAASVFEHAFTFVDVVMDEHRAVAWSNHTDPRRAFMSPKKAVTKFVDRMPLLDDDKCKEKCRKMAVYEDLCQFKHANPRSVHPRPGGDGYCDNRMGPDTTEFGVCSASAAVLNAASCVALALHQWTLARSLPAEMRSRFEEELAAMVRQQEAVRHQTGSSCSVGFDGRVASGVRLRGVTRECLGRSDPTPRLASAQRHSEDSPGPRPGIAGTEGLRA